ncbi:CDP-glucose 4,6-dehydratase [Sphingobium herbicidovorans]
MEEMGLSNSFWAGRSVFLTGHTGFMGGWLATYLIRRGACVHGYALPPPSSPNFFEVTDLAAHMASSIFADVRDLDALSSAMRDARPSVVFHLAAQPLVRRAFAEPIATVSTNVMGTANLLEAVRHIDGVQAAVVVTTDKVYRNFERHEPYSEDDELGGLEPYSASKAASEFIVDAWRHSYLDTAGVGVATVRAGNIFGGGDWAADRLVPDAVRMFTAGKPLLLRHPNSTRPWQHVLDPLSGYLTLAEQLASDREPYSEGWNFGPATGDCRSVRDVARLMVENWGEDARFEIEGDERIFEQGFLSLSSNKARKRLDWTPRWSLEVGIQNAMEWYRVFAHGADMWEFTLKQMERHESLGERA